MGVKGGNIDDNKYRKTYGIMGKINMSNTWEDQWTWKIGRLMRVETRKIFGSTFEVGKPIGLEGWKIYGSTRSED